MDPNHNIYSNMDGSLNMSQNGSLQSSVDFNAMSNFTNLQNLTPEQILQLQQINQQKIDALAAQLAQAQMFSPPVTTNPYVSNYSLPTTPTGPQIALGTGIPGSPVMAPHIMPGHQVTSPMAPGSPVIGRVPVNSSINLAINGQVPMIPQNNSNTTTAYNQMAYPNTSVGINNQLPKPIHVQVPNQTGQYMPNTVRNVTAPDSLNLHQHHTNLPFGTSYSSSSYSSSPASTPQDSPAMPKKPTVPENEGPVYMQRPRQRVLSPPPVKPPSDRGSTSSASIPGSPGSSGNPPLSPDGSWSDTSGPLSPDGTPRKGVNGVAQIKNKPLQMQTKYPQDKCYKCMKRVYPMEKLGPVRGVVYHKGCFKCNTCNTTLHLKNFFHSQNDNFDLSVYCKSHQPLSTNKAPKLGPDSLEIKSALSTPKKGGVTPESERVPVHKYSYDVTCREIEHARKAPVADLQSGVKARNHVWSKSKRENYQTPTTEVVRYDEPVPEYNADEYNRFQIESQPDYT